MSTAATFCADLENAHNVFAELDALERCAIAHNAGQLSADPTMQAWIKGAGREPSSRKMVNTYCAAVARKQAGAGRYMLNPSEARGEDLIAAVPAALDAIRQLTARLRKLNAAV